MELTVREAAALMGRSPRTVRAQVARGALPGVKRNGRWSIPRHSLPLTETQRQRLQAKADRVREAVEDALPSRTAATSGQRQRSLADLDAFRHGAELLAGVRGAGSENVSAAVRDRVAALLEGALLALAEAVEHFDRQAKLEAIHRCRAQLSHSLGVLLIEGGIPPGEPIFSWVRALETAVLPAVAGFARWVHKLRGRGR